MTIARRFFVRGRVQGVGYRAFVQRAAHDLSLRGYVRNLLDGGVEVYAVGPPDRLDTLAGHLWQGPRWADVRAIEHADVEVIKSEGFRIVP